MTAFDLCRQRPELELTPILRIVKYLGLDSGELADGEVDRVIRLYPFFQEDPELVIGHDDIAAETGLEPGTVRQVLDDAQGPMKVADITREVLSQGVEINAEKPNVTVSSILSSYEVFRRVKRGYYVLTS